MSPDHETTPARNVISIDYDDTWTEDPVMWRHIAELMRSRGHIVVMCTSRAASNPVDGVPAWVEVYYTNGAPKAAFMAQAGLMVSIWVDDMPQNIGDAWGRK